MTISQNGYNATSEEMYQSELRAVCMILTINEKARDVGLGNNEKGQESL